MSDEEENAIDAGDPPAADVVVLKVLELPSGRSPFADWFRSLKDPTTRARVENRLARIRTGAFGDTKPVGGEVFELRLDFGPGYRIYFVRVSESVVVLLGGGDKATQKDDIQRAMALWKGNKGNAQRYLRGL